jgi:hypothetical protein
MTCNLLDNLISSVKNEAADDERLRSKTLGKQKKKKRSRSSNGNGIFSARQS